MKNICDDFDIDYKKFKSNCDDYFYLTSRKQTRGLGGIFFDGLHTDKEKNLGFILKLANEFTSMYDPFLEYKNKAYTEVEKEYSLLRRGLYAEFIYVYDKGIKFGLATSVQIKSMLSSLPPMIKYLDEWKLTEEQSHLDAFFYKKTDWVNYKT